MRGAALTIVALVADGASAFAVGGIAARTRVASPLVRMEAAAEGGFETVVANARARAAAVKEDQDATTAAMAVTTGALFLLPGVENPVVDLILCSIVGGGVMGYVAGFRQDAIGDVARKGGGLVASAAGTAGTKVGELDEQLKISDSIMSALPKDADGNPIDVSYATIKKYGVSGTLAYILTELAFWAIAFPVASASFFNLNGHWPDFSDGSDRTAVLAFIFAGANVARLVVPLRFAAAFALVPWVDENIVQRFGMNKEEEEEGDGA